MDVIAGARLTAAVSAAGGFGILGGGYGDEAWLEQETAKLADVSDPFGIGFITWSLAKQPALLDIALEAAAARDHAFVRRSQAVRAAHQVVGRAADLPGADEDMARQALDAGADILIAQGTEAGGHGASRTTLDIVPAIVDLAAGRVPVAAAGGIGDGRGLAAMMMLGASGVLLGTRFYASQECDGAGGSETAHLRRVERQQRPRHHLRSLAQQCLAGAVHRPLPDQRSCAALDRPRGRTDAERRRRSRPNMRRRRRREISTSPPSLPAKPSG